MFKLTEKVILPILVKTAGLFFCKFCQALKKLVVQSTLWRKCWRKKKIMWLLYFRQFLPRFPKPGVCFLSFWRYELWGGNRWVLVPAMPERGHLPRLPGELLLLVRAGLPRGALWHRHRRVLQPALPPWGTLHGRGRQVRLPAWASCSWSLALQMGALLEPAWPATHFLPNSRFHSLLLH